MNKAVNTNKDVIFNLIDSFLTLSVYSATAGVVKIAYVLSS